MAESRLTTRWWLELEVLSPLHVGAGGPPLARNLDFVADEANGRLWVIDLERALADVPDDRLARMIDRPLDHLLRPDQYAAAARYELTVPDKLPEAPQAIVPCARDVEDRPYLPGSSLKGAVRTAVGWAMITQTDSPEVAERLRRAALTAPEQLDRRGRLPAAERVGRAAERDLFGPDPNHDVLRALRIGDLHPTDGGVTSCSVVDVFSLTRSNELRPKSGYRWYLETLPAGASLTGEVSLDEHLLGPAADPLGLGERGEWVRYFAFQSARFALALAEHEWATYGDWGLPAVRDWYGHLYQRAEAAARGDGTVGLLHLGWGTGWLAKTLGLALRDDRRFEQLVRAYSLDQNRGAATFPKTRRLLLADGVPYDPPGWVAFRLTPAA